jgi:ankyrin repeat protein
MSNDRALARRCIAILEQEEKFHLLELGVSDIQNTALHWAAYFGCTLVAELLLETIDSFPLQAIPQKKKWWTLRAKNKQIAEELAKNSVNVRIKNGYTPLSLAAQGGHEAVVRLLVNVPGVSISSSNKYGDTPLSCAALNGHEAVVRLLLTVPGVDVNSPNSYGSTPLSRAARNGHEAVVRLLLNVPGVDINLKNVKFETPLSLATRERRTAIVRLLRDTPGIEF